jgi:NAD(P)H-hydrate epimerase
MKILTAAEMREVDRLTAERAGVPSLTLMENAGTAVADFLQRQFPSFERRKILVLCGKGNNGGDGFVVARRLRERGADPRVLLFATPESVHGDAAVNLKRWREMGGELQVVQRVEEWQAAASFSGNEVVVDALLGTGLRGPVEGLLQRVIQDVNHRPPGAYVVAVDTPSGLASDSGELTGDAVVANSTVTFTAPKLGQVLGSGSSMTGGLVVCDIGSPRSLTEEAGGGNMHWLEAREFAWVRPRRQPTANKGDYGHALIVAGSRGKGGAAVLCGWAALRAGAGLVTVATPDPVLATVAASVPELMTEPLVATEEGTISLRCFEYGKFAALPKGKRVAAVGPGLSTNAETQQVIRQIVSEIRLPVILDADGLNAYAGRSGDLKAAGGHPLAITPHPGEMARLLGTTVQAVQQDRVGVARRAAAEWGIFVVLKGFETVIAAPDGRVWINSTGNPGMATAGTGDVLTGMLAGLTAQLGAESWPLSLCYGVYLHGLAGDIAAAETGEAPLMASDVIRAIPRALAALGSEIERG